MSGSISIHPRWRHLVQARLLRELRDLDVTVEINEDGLMRATWPVGGGDDFQTSVIVKLQVLPARQHNAGWAADPSRVARQGDRLVITRQLAP